MHLANLSAMIFDGGEYMEVLDDSKLFQPIVWHRISDCTDRHGCDCFDRRSDLSVTAKIRDRSLNRYVWIWLKLLKNSAIRAGRVSNVPQLASPN